jgi:ribosomal protein S27AE
MAASGRVVGLILIVVGLVIGAAILVWLLFGVQEGTLKGSGAAFGFVLLFGFIVLPLVGAGIYLLVKGRSEAKDIARVEEQRKLLGIVATQGQIAISDLVLEMHSTRDQIKTDLYELVSRGLFSGYVDWNKGELYSVDASQLEGRQTCPNCGGKLELVGKGLIKCPYCGAEIFLSGTK